MYSPVNVRHSKQTNDKPINPLPDWSGSSKSQAMTNNHLKMRTTFQQPPETLLRNIAFTKEQA